VVQAPVALRVDVDTRRGLTEGVPRLLDVFRRLEIAASFFVTMGPERSGTAIRRAWRPSFVVKMLRTNPFRLYGVRALLAGTLLPARPPRPTRPRSGRRPRRRRRRAGG
jgi:undecaprenyl phosphate-alpha-L-ara4FN deformylase